MNTFNNDGPALKAVMNRNGGVTRLCDKAGVHTCLLNAVHLCTREHHMKMVALELESILQFVNDDLSAKSIREIIRERIDKYYSGSPLARAVDLVS